MDVNDDAVFFGGDEAVGLPLLKALRKAGSTVRFVVADAMCDASTLKGAIEFDGKGVIKDGTVVIYQSIGGQLIEQRNLH